MLSLQPEIRNTVRAVIIRQQQLLLLKKEQDGMGVCYALPGGAQETGETLREALIRECREEIGCTIKLQDILHVADYFKYKPLPQPSTRHQLEILFQCDVPESYRPQNGPKPDKHQIAVVWIDLQELDRYRLSPQGIAPLLENLGQNEQAVYAEAID